jgi:hypothetical protein
MQLASAKEGMGGHPPILFPMPTIPPSLQEFRVPEVDVPLRALKVVRGGRFVLGQTALNHAYIEIDREKKSIGFAK